MSAPNIIWFDDKDLTAIIAGLMSAAVINSNPRAPVDVEAVVHTASEIVRLSRGRSR